MDSIFTKSSLGDLGVGAQYSDKAGVDTMLKDSYLGATTPCIYCGGQAQYKIMPKNNRVASAQVDKAYICTNCLKMGYLDKENYGIREC